GRSHVSDGRAIHRGGCLSVHRAGLGNVCGRGHRLQAQELPRPYTRAAACRRGVECGEADQEIASPRQDPNVSARQQKPILRWRTWQCVQQCRSWLRYTTLARTGACLASELLSEAPEELWPTGNYPGTARSATFARPLSPAAPDASAEPGV